MRENEFRAWLEHVKKLAPRPINDYVSRCKRVMRCLQINLDEELKKDKGRDALKLLVDNSTAVSRLEFSKGANVQEGLASLRSAVMSYFEFCHHL